MVQDFNIYIIEDTINGTCSLPLFLLNDMVAKQEFYKFSQSFKELPEELIPDYRLVRIGDYHCTGEGSYMFSTDVNYVLASASTDFSMKNDFESIGIDFYRIPYSSPVVLSEDSSLQQDKFSNLKD